MEHYTECTMRIMLIYVTPSYRLFTLSQILNILHKIHIFVSDVLRDDNPEPKVDGVCFADNLPYTHGYDFTIPDDVNVVWGACRDVSTTDF